MNTQEKSVGENEKTLENKLFEIEYYKKRTNSVGHFLESMFVVSTDIPSAIVEFSKETEKKGAFKSITMVAKEHSHYMWGAKKLSII